MNKKESLEDFDKFYREIYNDRWDKLREAMALEKPYIKIPNLKNDYFVDEASFFIVSLLNIEDGDSILDLCSAPGGKSFCLLSKLNTTNSLYCNELSRKRRARLLSNINEFVKDEKKGIIKTTSNFDACKIGLFQKEKYEKIMLDIPCSSEGHIIKDKKLIKNWSKSKSKRLQIQAHTMLQSALIAAKTGGTILYSTCSISPFENDFVIKKTMDKNKYPFKIKKLKIDKDYIEKSDFGFQIFPDKAFGRGPLYFSVLEKL